MEMTPERWRATHSYLRDVFGQEDPILRDLTSAAAAAGLPDISVGPVVGRLLSIVASLAPARSPDGVRVALEIGTLGGYSAIWIARGLGPRGRLITVEIDPRHAAFAAQWFQAAGLQDRVSLRQGNAVELLPIIADEVGEGGLDMVFFDAEKTEYPEYWRLVRPLVAVGGLVVIDNALGSGSWWIDEPGHPAREAADRVARMIAGDEDFEAVAVPLRQGVMIARRRQ